MSSQMTLAVEARYQRAKRALDVVVTLLLLAPLSIIMLIAAAAIRLDSKGPIIFRQRRVGKDGVEFDLLKFRSMYVDCDDTLHRQAIERYLQGQKLNEHSGARAPYKLGNDPRITRVGRFIRGTSIDELPQLWNVLVGQMTLVGPRPPLPYEVEMYSPRALLRLAGKPGLTGIWQVYGRDRVTFDEMVEMDITYLQQQSFWLDIKLLLLTPLVIFGGHGGV
jgi:lipopolysaccharide/colanic/teichoic acid biosynthesis glycosyltransferase